MHFLNEILDYFLLLPLSGGAGRGEAIFGTQRYVSKQFLVISVNVILNCLDHVKPINQEIEARSENNILKQQTIKHLCSASLLW